MSEDKDNRIELGKEIQKKLQKISEIFKTSLNNVVHASLLHGFNHFWLPMQEYSSELKVEDLKDQIESSHKIFQNFDDFESKFEDKYPFGTFSDLQERHNEFIKFIEILNKPKDVEKEKPQQIVRIQRVTGESIKKEEPEEEEEEEEEKAPPKPTTLKWLMSSLKPEIHNAVDVIKLMIFFTLCITANFYIFYGLYLEWPIFLDFEYHWRIQPYFTPFLVISILGIIIISSTIIGKILYYLFNKF